MIKTEHSYTIKQLRWLKQKTIRHAKGGEWLNPADFPSADDVGELCAMMGWYVFKYEFPLYCTIVGYQQFGRHELRSWAFHIPKPGCYVRRIARGKVEVVDARGNAYAIDAEDAGADDDSPRSN